MYQITSGRAYSRFFSFFFSSIFPSTATTSCLVALLSPAKPQDGSLNYLIQRRESTQNENTPELMDRGKDTYNSRTNRDSMIGLTTDGYFPAIFAPIVAKRLFRDYG